MKQTNRPQKSKVEPQRRQRIQDPALVWPEDIAEKLPNELELAQLVVAHLPNVTGYHTLPEKADGALHQVLDVLAAIRRWKREYRWPSESPEDFKKSQERAGVALEIAGAFNSLAGDSPNLKTEAFLRAILYDARPALNFEVVTEGWKDFCKAKVINPEDEEWTCEQAKMYGPEFRLWFLQKKQAIEKRLRRRRKSVASVKGMATRKKRELEELSKYAQAVHSVAIDQNKNK